MPKTIRRTALIIALGFVLSACQADVLISTRINEAGGGTFSLAVALDMEARVATANAKASGSDSGLASLGRMFERLRQRGWTVSATEPDGGLRLEATKDFADAAGFEALLGDLRAEDAPDVSPLGTPEFKIDFETQQAFFRTRSAFRGSFDTAPDDADLREGLRSVAEFVNFEVRATLPGGISVEDGAGTVEGDTVVWRPELGSRLTFLARSSALRVGPVLAVIFPALLLLCLLGWLLIGRRTPTETIAIVPDSISDLAPIEGNGLHAGNGVHAGNGNGTATIVLDEERDPIEGLLAIERDPIES